MGCSNMCEECNGDKDQRIAELESERDQHNDYVEHLRADVLLALVDKWDKRREKRMNSIYSEQKNGNIPSEPHAFGEAVGLGFAIEDLRRLIKNAAFDCKLKV